ncbi:MAG: hypothetical protein K6G83_04660 [Lachnospiraceae bacterium]|nr:hypothetical protein [Lachnospiraceae bacterium]
MKFKNAYHGVKRIYTAEIMAIIGTIALLIGGIVALASAAEEEEEALASVGSGALVVALVGGLLLIVSFIMNLTGLKTASKDEEKFGTAYKFAIAGIIAGILTAVPVDVVQDIARGFDSIVSVIISLYVISAVIILGRKLGNMLIIEKGKRIKLLIFIAFGCSILATVLGSFVMEGTLAAILEIIGSAMMVIQYFLYLSFLGEAKRMLD